MEGGLGPLFDNIMRMPSDFDIITHCTETLANLSEDSKNKLQVLSSYVSLLIK
jgi:hypothetical protein